MKTLELLYKLQTRYSSFDMVPKAMKFATDRAIDKLESCVGASTGCQSNSHHHPNHKSQHPSLPELAQGKSHGRQLLDFDEHPSAAGIESNQFGLGYSLLEGFSQCGFPDFAPFDNLDL